MNPFLASVHVPYVEVADRAMRVSGARTQAKARPEGERNDWGHTRRGRSRRFPSSGDIPDPRTDRFVVGVARRVIQDVVFEPPSTSQREEPSITAESSRLR